jgi:hypothetical protein
MPVFLDVHKLSHIEDMIDAPNKETIEKYHSKFNLKCYSITEVTMMSG